MEKGLQMARSRQVYCVCHRNKVSDKLGKDRRLDKGLVKLIKLIR